MIGVSLLICALANSCEIVRSTEHGSSKSKSHYRLFKLRIQQAHEPEPERQQQKPLQQELKVCRDGCIVTSFVSTQS